MARTIQIRNVPDALHRRLKSRAAQAGMPLSKYPLKEIRTVAEMPTMEEMRARLQRHPQFTPSIPTAKIIRAMRGR
jgi:plasmid stability protein